MGSRAEETAGSRSSRARPLLYLPFLYLLIVSVCRTFTDYRRVYYAAILGIVVQSLISIKYLIELPAASRESLDSLNEHGSSIGMNLVFAMAILSLVYKGISWRLRLGLSASAPVLWVYLTAQRRAAVVGLVTALIVFTIILFWRQRRTFWKVVPIGAIIVVGYVGAFWTNESSAGFPAQAVKSVIAPNSMSAEDQSSDEYRKTENFDLSYTISSSPIMGLGFGHPFLRPVPLPDISTFEFNAYLPHNSLLWIWIKVGFAGFVTVLYVLARSLSLGARRIRDAAPALDLLLASNAAMFVVMYAVYIFVDVAWEARNVTLLALSMGLCTSYLSRERHEDDVISLGGGHTPDALIDVVNLAAVVVDGSRFYEPHVGPQIVNINTATIGELHELPGVGRATAAAIVAEREQNGPFAGVDDLDRVPGIGPAKLRALRELVTP